MRGGRILGALVLAGCPEPRVRVDPFEAMDADVDAAPDASLDASTDAAPDGLVCPPEVDFDTGPFDEEALGGEPVPFERGADLPAGTYRLEYVDGCIKFAPGQWWSIHAHENGSAGFWLIGDGPDDRKMLMPGTFGYLPGTSNGGRPRDGFERFEDCVAANLAVPPARYEHAGGPLGLWLADTNYPDNVAGLDGRNPVWRVSLVRHCGD